MTLDTVIMLLGAFVAILPFLQLPPEWMSFFAFVAGIIIVGLGIAVRRRGMGHAASSIEVEIIEDEEGSPSSEYSQE